MLSHTNEAFMEAITAKRRTIVARGARRHAQDWLDALEARLYVALPQPVLIDRTDYERLGAAARALLSAQLKIARHLVSTQSREALLRRFRVPGHMARFVDWDKFQTGAMTVARMDIVPTADGYQFCEFNVHSAVGGAESHGCYLRFCRALGLPADPQARSPDYHLAQMYTRIAQARGIERIVILDSVHHASLGYPRHDDLAALLQQMNPGCEVANHREDTYPETWLAPELGERTLVHRMFTYDEITDGCAFLARLADSGAVITNTFEAEMRMSKLWLALLWDDRYDALLDDAEREAVRRYVPPTCELTEDNLGALLAERAQWVFKFNHSYGGDGVLIGASTPADELERAIREKGIENWIAQRFVEAETLTMPYDDSEAVAPHHLVLGLYVHDGHTCGFFVRGSASSRVVNLSSGAGKMAWGLVLDAPARRHFIDRIRQL
ncbi:hypothetical protein [Burkholderia ubonensis]|uniref:hypothetical protein n=1 Tax=Burkholderia ubonensis TaxID=101571 RepID=UPI0007530DB2|nr:hypothetical protein [Burkholderia ubonensis]KUZ66081.1 hypothetical protein WI37_34530 [Burkholderia ubonensis]